MVVLDWIEEQDTRRQSKRMEEQVRYLSPIENLKKTTWMHEQQLFQLIGIALSKRNKKTNHFAHHQRLVISSIL